MKMEEHEMGDGSYFVIHTSDGCTKVVKSGILFENKGKSGQMHMFDVGKIDVLYAATCLTKFLFEHGLGEELLTLLTLELTNK